MRPFVPFVHELVALDLADVRLFVNQGRLDPPRVRARWPGPATLATLRREGA